MASKVAHRSSKQWRNFGKGARICDVNRFACQYADYEINYNLLITCNNRIKFAERRFLGKGNRMCKTFVVKVTDSFQGVLHYALYLPLWMKFTNFLDKNLLQINEVINKVIQNSPIFNQNNKSKEYFFSMKGPLDRECCPEWEVALFDNDHFERCKFNTELRDKLDIRIMKPQSHTMDINLLIFVNL